MFNLHHQYTSLGLLQLHHDSRNSARQDIDNGILKFSNFLIETK